MKTRLRMLFKAFAIVISLVLEVQNSGHFFLKPVGQFY